MLFKLTGSVQSFPKILFIAFCIRFFFLVILPFDDTHVRFGIRGFNDEWSHIHYIQYLTEYKKLPVQTDNVQEPLAFIRNEFEYYQPPLYYFLAMPVYSGMEWMHLGLGKYGGRFLSVIFGVMTVIAVSWAGTAFNPKVARLSGLSLALFPTHIYYSSLVSNDSLLWLLSSIWVGLILHLTQRSLSTHKWNLFGILGLGLLTKSSIISQIPLLLILPSLAYFKNRDCRFFTPVLWIVSMAFLIGASYYYRNFNLYGSFLALEIGAGPQLGYLRNFSWHNLVEFLSWTVMTFWYPFNFVFGFQSIYIKILVMFMTSIIAIVLGFGWVKIRMEQAILE